MVSVQENIKQNDLKLIDRKNKRKTARTTHPAQKNEFLKWLPQNEFDQILINFDDISIDQIAGYKNLQVPGRTQLVVAYRNGRPIGGAVVVLYTLPYLETGLANVRFGPFWRKKGEEADPQNYRVILRLMIEEFADRQGHMIRILPNPNPSTTAIELPLLESAGLQADSSNSGSNRFLVNLSISEAEQMASLSQKWRYNLRKSFKFDMEFHTDNCAESHRMFAQVHMEMLKRKRVDLTDDLNLVPALREILPEPLKPKTYLVKRNNTLLAGASVMPLGATAMYWYGATSNEGTCSGAGYFLQWNIVKELSRQGYSYYDLGGSSHMSGLQQFKKGLAGRNGWEIEMQPEHFYASNLKGSMLGGAIQILRKAKAQGTYLRNRK